jgi:hypothetical protein
MGFPGLSLFFLWFFGDAHATAITMIAISSNIMIDLNFKRNSPNFFWGKNKKKKATFRIIFVGVGLKNRRARSNCVYRHFWH